MTKTADTLSRWLLLSVLFLGGSAFAVEIFVDQAGYPSNAPKPFFVDAIADSFTVRHDGSGQIVYRDALALYSFNDPATGMLLYRGDFAALTTPGRYYIEVASNHSVPFDIANAAYDDLYRKSLKGFYFQRCGVDLLGPHADPYFRQRGHIADGFMHPSSGQSGFRSARGGWYDAGDYGKYIVNAGITTGTLLMAYEWFPGRFSQDDLNIPEEGNGVPDILDETRVELEWMLTMQDSGGGVFHKLTRENFSGFVMPADDSGTRYIFQISSCASADFAAVMARAARVFSTFDSAFSQQCRNAAVSAWQFLQAHPGIVPPGGFRNPAGVTTGQYGDGDDSDERLWAAVELFLTTGESSYHNYYLSRYAATGLINHTMAWPAVNVLAHLAYLRGMQSGISSVVQTALRISLQNYCQSLANTRNQNGFHVTLSPGEYNWGCNSTALNRALLLIIGYEETATPDFRDAALDQLHYVNGMNAHNLAFTTGVGQNYPLHPHHRPSEADGIVEPIPGLIAGGPDQFLSDPVLQGLFNSSTPPALCYIDDLGSYASNEIAINWNAPLVFVAGYFAAADDLNGLGDARTGDISTGFHLAQNYPNPFNGSTFIAFRLVQPASVRIAIHDVNGRKIFGQPLGRLSAGPHRFRWDDRGNTASGVYYYSLSADGKRMTRKMLYLK